jgi:hypothetical protein
MEALLDDIERELKRQPLRISRSRKNTGPGGKTATFGVVRKRTSPPDYSRLCWWRPYLYGLLLEYAHKYISHDCNSMTINQLYQCMPHTDAGNIGPSTVVGFGNYTGGELYFGGEPHGTLIDVRYKQFTGFFQNTVHHVLDFEGERYSIVFYYCPCKSTLPPPSVRLTRDGRYVFYRGECPIVEGLPHPNHKGRVLNNTI